MLLFNHDKNHNAIYYLSKIIYIYIMISKSGHGDFSQNLEETVRELKTPQTGLRNQIFLMTISKQRIFHGSDRVDQLPIFPI